MPVIETDAGASLSLVHDTHPATADFDMMQSCEMGLANRWCPNRNPCAIALLILLSIFALASLLWVTYGLLNRKPAIYVGNIIGLVMNVLMVNGILMNAGWTY